MSAAEQVVSFRGGSGMDLLLNLVDGLIDTACGEEVLRSLSGGGGWYKRQQRQQCGKKSSRIGSGESRFLTGKERRFGMTKPIFDRWLSARFGMTRIICERGLSARVGVARIPFASTTFDLSHCLGHHFYAGAIGKRFGIGRGEGYH